MSQINIAEPGLAPDIISQDPEVKSGVPVFSATRVPARLLLNYLVGGKPLDEFLEDYPTVNREQAASLLEMAFAQAIGPRDEKNPLR